MIVGPDVFHQGVLLLVDQQQTHPIEGETVADRVVRQLKQRRHRATTEHRIGGAGEPLDVANEHGIATPSVVLVGDWIVSSRLVQVQTISPLR